MPKKKKVKKTKKIKKTKVIKLKSKENKKINE